MRRAALIFVLGSTLGLGWFLWRHYEIQGLDQLVFRPRGTTATPARRGVERNLEANPPLRLLSLSSPLWSGEIPKAPDISEAFQPGPVLAEIISSFDVVALHGIRGEGERWLRHFVAELNSAGETWELVLGSPVGPRHDPRQFAVLFHKDSVEVDPHNVYTIEDPDDLIRHEPLVAWLRAKGPEETEAFTFSLVLCQVHEFERERELEALARIFVAVRDDGREEDDVVLVGDMPPRTVSHAAWDRVSRTSQLGSLLSADEFIPQRHLDMVWDPTATSEHAARQGLVNVVREFNLTVAEAEIVATPAPAWAEFHRWEGGPAPRVAAGESPAIE